MTYTRPTNPAKLVSTLELPQDYTKLSVAERRAARRMYEDLQEGKCYHCKTPLATAPVRDKPIVWTAFPVNFMHNPVHLHHDHATGMTIGAVHAYCNAVLWQYHGE